MNAFELAAAMIWAIEESWLRTILEIAGREGDGPEAVAAKLGRPLNNTRTVSVRDGVAIVPVVGPIFRRGNMLTEVSGATSTEMLARDFRAAIDDPAVKAILLDVDSPGGEASGVNELANMIYAARGTKPVTAYVSGTAASGAYWIASAADEIVIDDTARLGSIGVVSAYRDTKARDEKAGVKSIEFVSSQSPMKRPNLESDEGRAQIQQQIDAIADVFIDAVARNRDTSGEAVQRDFGAGGVKIGASAIAAGMADKAGSFESTLAALSAYDAMTSSKPRRRRMSKRTTTQEAEPKPAASEEIVTDTDTVASLTEAARTKGYDEGQAAGYAAGVKAERDRIAAIDEIALPGHEALVAQCKAEGASVEETKTRILQAEKQTRGKHLERMRADGSVQVPVVSTTTGDVAAVSGDDSNLTLEERCERDWKADAELRATFEKFGGFNAYVAGERAAAMDLVKIKSVN